MINKNNLKIALLCIPFVLSALVPITLRIQSKTVEAKTKITCSETSGNADEVKGVIKINKGLDGGIIGTYNMDGRTFAVTSIPDWKLRIYNAQGISEQHKLMLHTINTLECGDWNGFCLNSSDSGPFQINQIHREDYKYSAYLVKKGKEAREKARKTNDFTEVNKIRDELFTFQVKWTIKRMETFRKKCTSDKLSNIMKCQAIRHNGNTKPSKGYGQFRFWYGNKASKSISMLYDYYLTK